MTDQERPEEHKVTCPVCRVNYTITDEEHLLRKIFEEDDACLDCSIDRDDYEVNEDTNSDS